MIIIYTGNGKGKTSACVGQAIRAHGQGKSVAFGQFFKCADQAGEQKILKNLLQTGFRANGPGFYFEGQDYAKHRHMALELLHWAREQCGRCFMLVLDEALYALNAELLTADELRELIALCRDSNTHLVLSGRGLPAWLEADADLVSDIGERKHPMQIGGKAQAGIEF